ncbi:hypothetical protein QYF61_010798 [Mycteria americana]|uniref:Uncharacterized protein n=1 Tax=Mycteria americana TaxID=33587 RepID=A0AAN7N4I0_MYCAM|nr:hypothetical protein QYF61_010798 [Mycteria americana]
MERLSKLIKKAQHVSAVQACSSNSKPGLHQPECCQQSKGYNYTTLLGHTWNTVFKFGLSTFKRDKEKLERIQWQAIKMTRGLEDRGNDMPWQMKKGLVVISSQCSKTEKTKACLSQRCMVTRHNAHKLLQGKFHLDIRKEFFTVREIKLWSKLPRELVECPLLERALDNLIYSPAFNRGLDQMTSRDPFQPGLFEDLMTAEKYKGQCQALKEHTDRHRNKTIEKCISYGYETTLKMSTCMHFFDKKGKTLNSLDMAKAIQTTRNGLVNMRRTEPHKARGRAERGSWGGPDRTTGREDTDRHPRDAQSTGDNREAPPSRH